MKALLLGGTGAIGYSLSHFLVKNEIKTFVTSRKEQKSEGNLYYLQGNAKDLSFLVEVLKREYWDVIIDFMIYDTKMFEDRLDLFLENTKQYIYLSSARVYACSDNCLKEDSLRLLDFIKDEDYLLTEEYALTKARQENLLEKHKKNNWTIVRPYITYSKDRLQMGVLEKEDWLYRVLHGRSLVFSKDILDKETTLTLGVDVAYAIFKLIGHNEALGQTFHITSQESMKWEDLLSIYVSILNDYLGYMPKVHFQNLDDFFEWNKSKYQILYDRMYNRKFDNSKILQILQNEHFTPVNIGLKSCMESFLKNPKFLSIDWRKEAIKDRQTKEITPLSEIQGVKSKIKYLMIRFGLINVKI